MSLSWIKVSALLFTFSLLSACSGGGGAAAAKSASSQGNSSFANGKPLVFVPVNFALIADANLRSCIKETGIVDTSLQGLDCSGRGISSVQGLEQFGDLRTLNLSQNQLRDLDGIEKLHYLYALDVSYNQLTDLDALQGLTYLHTLDASHNQITELSALENSNLKRLYVKNNNLSLSFISNRLLTQVDHYTI